MGYQSEQLEPIVLEGQKLHKFYSENPEFGVEAEGQSPVANDKTQKKQQTIARFDEDIEIVDSGYNHRNAQAYASGYLDEKSQQQVDKKYEFIVLNFNNIHK